MIRRRYSCIESLAKTCQCGHVRDLSAIADVMDPLNVIPCEWPIVDNSSRPQRDIHFQSPGSLRVLPAIINDAGGM